MKTKKNKIFLSFEPAGSLSRLAPSYGTSLGARSLLASSLVEILSRGKATQDILTSAGGGSPLRGLLAGSQASSLQASAENPSLRKKTQNLFKTLCGGSPLRGLARDHAVRAAKPSVALRSSYVLLARCPHAGAVH